jgi:hypothetical protein
VRGRLFGLYTSLLAPLPLGGGRARVRVPAAISRAGNTSGAHFGGMPFVLWFVGCPHRLRGDTWGPTPSPLCGGGVRWALSPGVEVLVCSTPNLPHAARGVPASLQAWLRCGSWAWGWGGLPLLPRPLSPPWVT